MLVLKAHDRKEWAESFLDGCLYCNTLRYHREREDGHADPQEGAVVIPGSRISKLTIGDHDLTQDIRELTYRPDFAADRVNVFCMYCWAPPWVDEEQVLIDKESQLGSLRKLAEAYGPYSVIISDMSEFFNRLDQAVKRPDNRIAQYMRATVQYELTDVYPVELGRMIDLAFHKNEKYAWEQEYRLAFTVERETPGPFRLNIGSIRDIAFLMDTKAIYDDIAINGSREF